jgi:stage II sporulation protein D
MLFFVTCARHQADVIPPPPKDELVLKESYPSSYPFEMSMDNFAGECPVVEGDISSDESIVAGVAEGPPEPSSEVEEEIPVLEPKKAEVRKAYVEPTLKILIIEGANSITMKSESDIVLTSGDSTTKIRPGQKIKFKARSARVGVHTYPVGIATFRGTAYEKAIDFAEKWKHDGYTVRLIKAGGPFVHADGSVADTTVYWVALGSFKKKTDAARFKDKMNSWGLSAWVIDESVMNSEGNIEITDSRGAIYAYANSHVAISADQPIEIDDVPFGNGFWSSGYCENRRYTSPLEIYVNGEGELAAINLVGLEEYVKGIVPVEIRLIAPDEALKAQAIAARTEALAKLGIRHVFDPYDYCASQHCQEYGGLTRRTERTDAAVDATKGMVLMRDGNLIEAVYSANCGGHSEHNENVWSSRINKSLRGVSDLYSNQESFDSPIPDSQLERWLKTKPHAYCGDPRADGGGNFRWKRTFSLKKLTAAVNEYYNVGSIRSIKVLKRGVSGRVLKLRIGGTRTGVTIYKELEIRRVLGKLKSTMFVVDVKRDSAGVPVSFTFYGGGWGHGVGMCQAGAEGMALQGFDHAAILKHYFTGAEIVKLYDGMQ